MTLGYVLYFLLYTQKGGTGMSLRKRENDITGKILATGAVILVGCLAACLIQMLTLGAMFESNAEQTVLGHMQVALEVINNEITELQDVTLACAEELVSDEGKSDLKVLLWQCNQEFRGYDFYYTAPNGITYYSNGMEIKDGSFDILSTIHNYEYRNNFICLSEEGDGIRGEKKTYWIGVTPVKLAGFSEPGFLLCRIENQDMFQNECYDYISSLGVVCVVGKDGSVATADQNYTEVLGLGNNYFDALYDYSNGSRVSESRIDEIRSSFTAKTEGNFKFTSQTGKTVFVAYEEIQGTRDRYLMVMFHEDLVMDMIQPAMIRNFLLWTIILMVMLVTIGLVWQSGRSARKTVEKMAYYDPVTEGRNLNFFRKKATDIINHNREIPFLIYRFDIMNFRYINEAYGHGKADEVLKACITEFNRIYSRNELCVRINSDHFLALVLNNSNTGQNYQNYTKAIGECARANGVKYPIRLRVGIYQVRKDDMSIDIMMDRANAARKSMTGSEKILEATYSEKIVANMKKVDAIESQMHSALIKDEFKIYLQPKWDINNDCLVGAEALVRWVKEDGSIVYPSDFIPLFETNGFIEKLDFHMLENLCREIQKLENHDIYKLVPISVNQSRVLINNPDYVKNVERLISRYGTNVDYLEIEITETVFFDERDKMIEVVNQLKTMGIRLAMDDFGSGYSSLNILRDIPFDILKIDREFVNESVASKSSVVIVQKIIEMAKDLNIKIVCEGVETQEQIDILRRLGCPVVQGYYYDKPIPMQEFLDKYCKKDHLSKKAKTSVKKVSSVTEESDKAKSKNSSKSNRRSKASAKAQNSSSQKDKKDIQVQAKTDILYKETEISKREESLTQETKFQIKENMDEEASVKKEEKPSENITTGWDQFSSIFTVKE